MPDLSRLRPALLALPLLALAGCAVAPDVPPRITPAADVKPAFAVPSIRDRMIYLARQEWTLFGRPVVDYATTPPTLSYPPDVAFTPDGNAVDLSAASKPSFRHGLAESRDRESATRVFTGCLCAPSLAMDPGNPCRGDDTLRLKSTVLTPDRYSSEADWHSNEVETQPPFLSRVILYWYAVSKLPVAGYDGKLRPWSAAFIAWLARSAGVPRKDLPSTVLHWDYIEHALAAREGARFIARDAHRHAPKAGDLICAPRGEGFVHEVTSFERLRRGAYHCDIVAQVRGGELDAIGGNVLDSVSLTHVALDAEGRVLPTVDRPWLVVIEQRDVD